MNTIYPVHAQDITDRGLMSFKNHTIMPRYVDRQYEKLWGQEGNKRGATISLRVPPLYELRRGNLAQAQNTQEAVFPVTVGEPVGVDLNFSSQEMKLTVDDFHGRYIKNAVLPIANAADSDICGLYKKIFNFSGTPGSVPTAIDTYLAATTALALAGAPVEGDEWSMIIDYKSNQKIVNALAGQFNPQGNISKMWDSGRMGSAVGYKWSQDQNIRIHTVGALGGTPLVNGADQTGASIICDGTGGTIAGYVNEGDIVQFSAVFGIKKQTVPLGGSGESTGELANWVITQTTDSTGGAVTLPILGANNLGITISGPNQNATNAPADNAPVTIFGSASAYAAVVTRQNLAFNKGCFVFASIDLPLPGGMDMAARTTDEDTKLSMRFLRGFNIETNVYLSRLDMLYVAACPRPDFGARVVG